MTGAALTHPSKRREILLPYPHRGQQIVRSEAKRFNWLCAGRRWRKTTMAMSIAVEAALSGQRIVWGAPVYDQVYTGWLEAKRAADGIAHFEVSRMTAHFPRGGRIVYRSLDDPDNARSQTADGIVIDECGEVDSAAWYEVLRPMLMDTNGWGWFIGTPKGRNWFWMESQKARDRDDSAAWQAPTLGARIVPGEGLVRAPHPLENPNIPFTELLDMWGTTPERSFRQEVLAEWAENVGGVFRNVRSHINDGAGSGPTFVGVDWGLTNDFTVLTAMRGGQVVGFDRFNQVGWELQRGRLGAFCQHFQPELVLTESNSFGGPNLERLQIELPWNVEGFLTTAQSKRQLIDLYSLGMERDQVHYPEIEVFIAEHEAFEYSVTAKGNVTMQAPKGGHDDCVLPGTLIKTAAGYRPVESIRPGDMVLTHRGRYQQVESCIAKLHSGLVYDVLFRNQMALHVTANHPIYAAKPNFDGHRPKDFDKREWLRPEQFIRNCRCVSVVESLGEMGTQPLAESDFYVNPRNATRQKVREIALDDGLAGLLGRFVADGHCRKQGIYGLELAFHEDDRTISQFADYLAGIGAAPRIEATRSKCVKLSFSGKLLWHALRQTYADDGERRLPAWVTRLGPAQSVVLQEWLKGDGWRRKLSDWIIGCTTSPALALGMRDIAVASGQYASMALRKGQMRRGTRCKDQYWVSIRDAGVWPPSGASYRLSEAEYGSHLKTMTTRQYDGAVYNLQVAEDQSFTANGIVVHNCVISGALAYWAQERGSMPAEAVVLR